MSWEPRRRPRTDLITRLQGLFDEMRNGDRGLMPSPAVLCNLVARVRSGPCHP